MHNQETIDRFIQFRVQGMTFHDISANLNVPRSTLMVWSRKYRFEIDNQRVMNLEQLQHKHLKSYPEQINALGEQLRAVEEELKKRNLTDLPTLKLLDLADKLRQQILARTGNLKLTICSTPEDPGDSGTHRNQWIA